jgi:hypothetical protein
MGVMMADFLVLVTSSPKETVATVNKPSPANKTFFILHPPLFFKDLLRMCRKPG